MVDAFLVIGFAALCGVFLNPAFSSIAFSTVECFTVFGFAALCGVFLILAFSSNAFTTVKCFPVFGFAALCSVLFLTLTALPDEYSMSMVVGLAASCGVFPLLPFSCITFFIVDCFPVFGFAASSGVFFLTCILTKLSMVEFLLAFGFAASRGVFFLFIPNVKSRVEHFSVVGFAALRGVSLFLAFNTKLSTDDFSNEKCTSSPRGSSSRSSSEGCPSVRASCGRQ